VLPPEIAAALTAEAPRGLKLYHYTQNIALT